MFLNIFWGSTVGLGLFLLLLFSLLQWFQIPAGSFLDWAIGGAIFGWLVIIVTVPWNIHFQAKEVLAAAADSQDKAIPVKADKLDYVVKLTRGSWVVAIALHLISALGLYWLSASGASILGYMSSGAALLLTGLRPTIRGYAYLSARLRAIRQDFTYPREDIVELRDRVHQLETTTQTLQQQLNPDRDNSWVSQYQNFTQETRRELAQSLTLIERLRADNDAAHGQLAHDARQSIAQLSEDSEFLNHARELIRFFKSA